MIITSTHNEKLKEIRKLSRRRERDERGRFVAEGEDLIAAARRAGWEPVVLLAAADSGLEGEEVEQGLLDNVSGARLRVADDRDLRVALVRADGAAVRLPARRLGSRQRRHDPALGAGVRRRVGRARARLRGSVRPEGRARLDGRDLRRARRAGAGRRRPARRACRARRPAPASRCAGLPRARRRSSSVPSARACPPRSSGACERVARIPIATESLNAAMAATVALYELTREGVG